MEASGLLSGGFPVIKRFQINATQASGSRGIPMLIGTGATNAGVLAATTTGAADVLGLSLDNATYSTTQGTGASSAEALISLVINQDLIYKARINQGATEGTAETLYDVTTASSTGLVVNTADDWNGTTFAGGSVFGYDGANQSQVRKITSTDTTGATVVVPFDYATVVGDNFLRSPWTPGFTLTVQLTTNLWEADNSIVVGTGAPFIVIDQKFGDEGDSPARTRSYVFFTAGDHVLARLS